MGALDNTPRDWTTGEVVTAAMMNAELRDKFADLKARFITDTGWQDIAVLATFAAVSTAERPQVRKIGNVVYLRGGWLNTGMAAAGTHNVGTIPVGYRPPVATVCVGGSSAGGAAIASVHITTDGNVQVRVGATLGAYYKIDRQSYLID